MNTIAANTNGTVYIHQQYSVNFLCKTTQDNILLAKVNTPCQVAPGGLTFITLEIYCKSI